MRIDALARSLVLSFLALLLGATTAVAQESDSPDSADHPLVSRYEGSVIDGYEVKDFAAYALPVGPMVKNPAGEREPEKTVSLEGRVTRILYRGPVGRSTLEIARNYRSALEGAGFETLFACGPEECGRLFHWHFYKEMSQRIRTTKTSGSAFDIPQELRYLAVGGEVEGRTVHVSVLVAFDNGFSNVSKRPVTLLEVVESEAMETGKVTVDAEAMARGIDADGHISIYGVHFASGEAEVLPESSSTLEEIARLLGNRPDLGLLVVGHTDSEGGYDYNLDLSRRRSRAVVRELVDRFGIDSGRLQAEGVGYLAPVATNDTAAGRAKNRRVELVKR